MKSSSASLFHYTKKANGLFGIIEHGFRYSYCFEVFDETISRFIYRPAVEMAKLLCSYEEKYGIAIPMICFCDIPISRADGHRANYGDFCSGLHRRDGHDTRLRPHSQPHVRCVLPAAGHRRYLFSGGMAHRSGNLPRLNIDAIPAVKLLLSLVKTDISKYDEREWRIFWEENIDIEFGLTEEIFNQKRDEFNNRISNQYATFDSNIINHIIVPTESCIPCTIDKIKRSSTILGKVATDDDKEMLITKITTFERIDNDF